MRDIFLTLLYLFLRYERPEHQKGNGSNEDPVRNFLARDGHNAFVVVITSDSTATFRSMQTPSSWGPSHTAISGLWGAELQKLQARAFGAYLNC